MAIRKTVIVEPKITNSAKNKMKRDIEKPFEQMNKSFGGIKAFFAGAAIAAGVAAITRVVGNIRESFKDGADTLLQVVDRLDKVNDRAGFYGANTAQLGQVERLAGIKGLNQDQFYMVLDRFQEAILTARKDNPNSVSQFSTDTLTAFRQWQSGLSNMTDIAARNAEITRVLGMRIAGNASDFLTSDLGSLSKQLGVGMSSGQYKQAESAQDVVELVRARNTLALDKAVSGMAGTRVNAALMPEQKQLNRNLSDVKALSTTVRFQEVFIDLNNNVKDLSLAIAEATLAYKDSTKNISGNAVNAVKNKSFESGISAGLGLVRTIGVLP